MVSEKACSQLRILERCGGHILYISKNPVSFQCNLLSFGVLRQSSSLFLNQERYDQNMIVQEMHGLPGKNLQTISDKPYKLFNNLCTFSTSNECLCGYTNNSIVSFQAYTRSNPIVKISIFKNMYMNIGQ